MLAEVELVLVKFFQNTSTERQPLKSGNMTQV